MSPAELRKVIRENVAALRALAARPTVCREDEHDCRMIADNLDAICLEISTRFLAVHADPADPWTPPSDEPLLCGAISPAKGSGRRCGLPFGHRGAHLFVKDIDP